jgi:hypothetical protein
MTYVNNLQVEINEIINRVQIRYHEPHSPLWVNAYWVFILKYSQNLKKIFFKENLLNFKKISSHYYVMVHKNVRYIKPNIG